jgi:hypothetical protein
MAQQRDQTLGSDERERILRQQYSQQVQSLQQIIQEKEQIILQKDQALREKDETTRQQEREKIITIKNKERELRQKVGEISRLERQLGESERVIAQFQRRIAELEQLRPAAGVTPRSKEQSSSRASIQLTWREGRRAIPQCRQSDSCCASVDGSTLYIRTFDREVFGYNTLSFSWCDLPSTPTNSSPSVIINNLLTLIGGTHYDTTTNQLFSLTGEGSDRRWTEEFPPMPTKRWGSAALVTGTALIVVGGSLMTKQESTLGTVEMMNIATKQWSTAADLPQPIVYAPVAICGDQIYILGESKMYTCSATILTQSQSSLGVWSKLAAPPVKLTTCVSIHGRLLTIGGTDSRKKTTTAVHIYNPATDSWEVISHMGTPRWRCIAAVLPNEQLIVVGGYTGKYNLTTDSTELAAIELLY